MFNSKTSKKGLVEFIQESKEKLTGKKFKSLLDRVTYTMKKFAEDNTQVMREDLFTLASDILAAIGGTSTPAPVENSLKPVAKPGNKPASAPAPAPEKSKPSIKPKAGGKSDSDKAAEELLKLAEGDKKEDKKDDKKTTGKPASAPKKLITAKANANTEKALEVATQFPKEFEAEGVGKLKVNMDIKNMKDLYEAVAAGKSFIFALYWSQRYLKQFTYDTLGVTKKEIKEFPNDLDLCQLIYVSEEQRVAYVVSAYTDVAYTILPADLEIAEGMRFSSGIEYNIYEILE